jgi:hypothetical protein
MPEDPKRPEVMGTGHRRVATTTATTTNADAGTMITVTTGDVITNSRKTTATSTTCLPPPETGNPNSPFQLAKRSINMIVGGLKSISSRRRYCKNNREVQLIHTKPSQPLCWSEQPITFSRADHWVHIPDPGLYPLVVEPIVEGTLLPQTLIDGGSKLNVIFVATLKKMDFDFKRLIECDEPFFGIVPGVVWTSLGPLPRWVPGPTTRWAPGTTRLVQHGT